jgi:hypothetical protein
VPLADFHDEEFCRLLYKEKTDGSQHLRNRFHDEEFCRLPINVKTEYGPRQQCTANPLPIK